MEAEEPAAPMSKEDTMLEDFSFGFDKWVKMFSFLTASSSVQELQVFSIVSYFIEKHASFSEWVKSVIDCYLLANAILVIFR